LAVVVGERAEVVSYARLVPRDPPGPLAMPISYSVVARGTTILAEFSAQSGNYTALVKKVLEKIPATNNRQTYTFERHVYSLARTTQVFFFSLFIFSFSTRI
jgi:vesicle-associated membrane protein 7